MLTGTGVGVGVGVGVGAGAGAALGVTVVIVVLSIVAIGLVMRQPVIAGNTFLNSASELGESPRMVSQPLFESKYDT